MTPETAQKPHEINGSLHKEGTTIQKPFGINTTIAEIGNDGK